MIHAIAFLLSMQLLGEGLARLTGFGVPGPVIGLVLSALLLGLWPVLLERIAPLANTLLAHLSLLFVPAAVGLIQHLNVFAERFWSLIIALGVSTLLTLMVSAGVFLAIDRIMSRGATKREH